MNDFIKKMEQYYGINYSTLEKNLLQSYLKGKGDIDYKRLIGEVLKSHSKTFRSLPDIAIIDKCLPDEKDLETEAHNIFNKLMNNLNIYKDFMTSNKRLYSGIVRCGGWVNICNSKIEDQKWLRKDFVKGYCSSVDSIEIEKLRGIGNNNNCLLFEYEKKDCIEYVNQSQKNELKDCLKYALEGMDD